MCVIIARKADRHPRQQHIMARIINYLSLPPTITRIDPLCVRSRRVDIFLFRILIDFPIDDFHIDITDNRDFIIHNNNFRIIENESSAVALIITNLKCILRKT